MKKEVLIVDDKFKKLKHHPIVDIDGDNKIADKEVFKRAIEKEIDVVVTIATSYYSGEELMCQKNYEGKRYDAYLIDGEMEEVPDISPLMSRNFERNSKKVEKFIDMAMEFAVSVSSVSIEEEKMMNPSLEDFIHLLETGGSAWRNPQKINKQVGIQLAYNEGVYINPHIHTLGFDHGPDTFLYAVSIGVLSPKDIINAYKNIAICVEREGYPYRKTPPFFQRNLIVSNKNTISQWVAAIEIALSH